MDNYIGKIEAEWVDPAEETPMEVPTGSINPPAWEGLADFGEAPINPGLQFCAYHDDHGWSVGIDGMPFPLRWLRIGGPSDAIPREAVQAAHEAGLMKLTACSVAALANTRESARDVREIKDEYKSAAWCDVCSAVDREMDLRDAVGGPSTANDQLRAALSRIHDEEMGDSIEDPLRCHDAVNRFITRVQGIVCADLGCHSRDAIPRAQVQAAVDEMRDKADNAALDTPQEIAAVGIRGSIGCIAHHTGVTPSEVQS